MKDSEFFSVIIVTFVIIVITMIVGNRATTTNHENVELKRENYCYKVLIEEDIIGNDCDEYFENDSWYHEYVERSDI